MFKFKNLTYWGVVFTLITAFGCTKTFYIKAPGPSSVVYSQEYQEKTILKIEDQRSGEDKPLSTGTLPVVLVNMENEIFFLGTNLENALNSRGINLQYSSEADAGLLLNVKKYRIRNLRTSGFSPYWTFTTFAGDLKLNGESHRVVFILNEEKFLSWHLEKLKIPVTMCQFL